MKRTSHEALDAYFSQGDSWASDRNDALRASRRMALWVAAAASIVAVCEAFALIALMPLKTVVPYTLLVDRQTGFVQALKPLDPQMISADRALTESFLVQYVIAREGFDIDSLQEDYRKVALWSAGRARSDYITGMQASNPASPIARLPRSSVVDVRVKSVTSLSANVAMVRFDTVRRDASGQNPNENSWVAVIRFSYSGEPMSAEDRIVNPLGFKVSRYRRSAETVTAAGPINGPQTTAATEAAADGDRRRPLPQARTWETPGTTARVRPAPAQQ